MATTKTTTKPAGKTTAAKAPRKTKASAAPKKKEAAEVIVAAEINSPEVQVITEKPTIAKGRYVFATGRRKTAIANVRLFSGKGDSVVNKKPLEKYFAFEHYQEEVLSPLERTGLAKDFYFTAHINGGGTHSQAQALRHGIATALGQLDEAVRKVLKKNGLLTRDDRKKERKKPGLKRARRSPQWAKR